MPNLLTGSHYDTVRNGGKHDGRLGISCPWPACASCTAPAAARPSASRWWLCRGRRASATRPPSWAQGALVGDFRAEWLEQKDADGITMQAMQHAGLCVDDIPS